ncbi:MAG: hypothetical protein Q9208_004743 [Pyrenodesmia sp. 3 TL-2023]
MSHFYLNLFRLVAFLPVAAMTAQPQQTTDICKLIDSLLPGRISYPDTAIYRQSLSSYYTGQERDLKPGCIFRPTRTSEVSQFVKLITADGKHGRPTPQFAIRGGGHSLFSGAANIDGGVTVDMRSMKSVVLSPDHKVASVGGGAVFSDVYPQVVPYNLTVMGGRIPGIAVGGFTTGGGVNFLSRRYGWSCDNIYAYEVVLASGEIIYATASSHSDLWLALKGGSNNFGIITRFDLATFPMGQMWGGVIQFNYTKTVLAAQAKAFSAFMDPKNFDDAADMGIILGFQNKSYTIGNSLFYVEPIADPPTFQPFTSIPSLSPNSLALNNVADTVTQFGRFLPDDVARATEFVYSFKNSDAALYTDLIQTWEDSTRTLADIEGLQVQFLIQPQPTTNGTNSFGLTPGQTDVAMSVITAAYANAADDGTVQRYLKAITKKHENILRNKGLYLPFKYLNYADLSQDPIGSYGQHNKARLQAVSKKYDPNGLFQTGVPGGFKLFQ